MENLCDEGCEHLGCNCLIVCNICNKTYPCKGCHDRIENHMVRSKDISRMLCRQCGLIQTKSNECIKCHIKISKYFCKKCTVWSDKDDIFHCVKCDSCKMGSTDCFVHCDKCGVCIEKKATHNHMFGTLKNNCPICAESMIDQKRQVILMRCGHIIHEECYKATLENSVHCPICFKFIGDDEEIRNQIRYILTQTSTEQSREGQMNGNISCFECGTINYKERYGLFNACEGCGSYNTKIKEGETRYRS